MVESDQNIGTDQKKRIPSQRLTDNVNKSRGQISNRAGLKKGVAESQ